METFLQDVRYGIKSLAKHPGFAAVAILALALGIGANTTIYSWVSAVLLNPLPGVENNDSIVAITSLNRSGNHWSLSYPDFTDLREQAQSLSGVVVYELRPLSLSIGGESERCPSAFALR